MDPDFTFIFRDQDTDLLEAIRSGKKKLEVRAWNPLYEKIKDSDRIWFTSESKVETFEAKLRRIVHVSSLDELLSKYPIEKLDPTASSEEAHKNRMLSFPEYRERIKQGGLFVFEFE
jgi:ASC-1-like (ASCH) protein